jgi:hypothetical protein
MFVPPVPIVIRALIVDHSQTRVDAAQATVAAAEQSSAAAHLEREATARARAECARAQDECARAQDELKQARVQVAVLSNKPDTMAYASLLTKVAAMEAAAKRRETEFANVLEQMRLQHAAQHQYWHERVAAAAATPSSGHQHHDSDSIPTRDRDDSRILHQMRAHLKAKEAEWTALSRQQADALAAKNAQLVALGAEAKELFAALAAAHTTPAALAGLAVGAKRA